MLNFNCKIIRIKAVTVNNGSNEDDFRISLPSGRYVTIKRKIYL